MKHIILALLIILFPSCAAHKVVAVTPAARLTATQRVLPSLVRLTTETPDKGTYVCAGFSVATRVFLTAEHCLHHIKDTGAIFFANNHHAFVLRTDPTVDLALI